VQSLNHTNAFLTNRHLVVWNRMIRLMAVGRNLCFSAALGLVPCYWIIVSDAFGWQKSPGVFSSSLYGLLSCWGVGIVVLAKNAV
jgi:hypothetical protein